jgi:hypothetical protein
LSRITNNSVVLRGLNNLIMTYTYGQFQMLNAKKKLENSYTQHLMWINIPGKLSLEEACLQPVLCQCHGTT